MAWEYIDAVDSEDGLLVFGDAAALQMWRGTSSDEEDVNKIQSALTGGLPGLDLPIANDTGVIWNMEGPGTADVFRDEPSGHILLVRSWLTDPESMESVLAFSSIDAALNNAFAQFHIHSGCLAILSSTEDGASIHNANETEYILSRQDMMTETSGMLLPITSGHYFCYYDKIEIEEEEAIRCHVILEK
jgi:hypothetical protein